MYPVRKDLPFYTSLRMLRLLGFYPNGIKNYSEKLIVKKMVVIIVGWLVIQFSMLLLIYENSKDKNFQSVFFNTAVAVASTSAYGCSLRFLRYHQRWANIFTALVNYEKFGRPPRHYLLKQRGDKIAVGVWTALLIGLILYICWSVQHENDCEMESAANEVCGLIIPTWLPSPYNHNVLVKRLVLLYHIPNIIAVSSFVIITHINIQVNEFNIARIDHLGILFAEIGLNTDPHDQLHKMKHCIEYHQDIIRVSHKFKYLSMQTIGHMTLTFTVVTASMGYQIIQATKPFYQENAFLFEIIYITNMYIMCYCGQRLENKMKTIGDMLYSMDWYNFHPKVQKLIPLVLLSSQKTVGMDAVPVGSLNYELFVTLLKTTFSYFSLLNQLT